MSALPIPSATATLSSKFQISVPKLVREAQNWQPGQELVFIPKGEGLLLMPVPALSALKGMASAKRLGRKVDTKNLRDRADRF